MAREFTTEQVPTIFDPIITKTALIVQQSKKENSEDILSGKKDSEDEPPTKKLKQKLSFEQFTNQLFSTTSSSFATSPPREPTPFRDPSKGKGEMKRLADLKAEKEEYEKSLRKLMNPTTVKAQSLKLAEYEEKMAKMFNEYNKCIYERADQLPITKIHYRSPGFSEWLEVQALASKTSSKSNDLLHQGLRAKFNWIIAQAKKLRIPPLPELAHFGKSAKDKKRKRKEMLAEVFVKENIVVDEMKRNLAPPPGVEGRKGMVIQESKVGIFYYNGNFDL
ncbi:hypothetical protein Tco_1180296, partial [Tanacetum coccineum]